MIAITTAPPVWSQSAIGACAVPAVGDASQEHRGSDCSFVYEDAPVLATKLPGERARGPSLKVKLGDRYAQQNQLERRN
jgi:hypothetical protein